MIAHIPGASYADSHVHTIGERLIDGDRYAVSLCGICGEYIISDLYNMRLANSKEVRAIEKALPHVLRNKEIE